MHRPQHPTGHRCEGDRLPVLRPPVRPPRLTRALGQGLPAYNATVGWRRSWPRSPSAVRTCSPAQTDWRCTAALIWDAPAPRRPVTRPARRWSGMKGRGDRARAPVYRQRHRDRGCPEALQHSCCPVGRLDRPVVLEAVGGWSVHRPAAGRRPLPPCRRVTPDADRRGPRKPGPLRSTSGRWGRPVRRASRDPRR